MATTDERSHETTAVALGSAGPVAGGLMVAGLLINVGFTLAHPSGHEDDHPVIFSEYAASDAWVAVHLGQFVGVCCALAGLLVLYRILLVPGAGNLVAHLAAAAVIATVAVWAVLQGLDGVGLKQAVDTWADTTGPRRAALADAEIIRWLEWGFQSYFRILLGFSFALIGAAGLLGRRIPAWLGWAAVLAGVCSLAIGVDVGYSGLASGLQDTLSVVFLLIVMVFAFGVLMTAVRDRGRQPRHP